MKYRAAWVVCLLAMAVLLTGCGGGGSKDPYEFFDPNNGKSGPTEWTILVFLNADNDLERFGILNFNQMEQIGSTDQVKIVVQMDRSPGFDTSNGDWTDTRRFLVTRDNDTLNMTSPVVEYMGEMDMGDPEVLADFIRWGQANYPAKKYCLVLWNHGSGWRSYSSLSGTVPRNISFDDTSYTSIKTSDLPGALAAANPLIDVLAMDASLMQMLEVAYEVKDSARYMVGSEESPPGEGYEYHRWLGRLVANPTMSPAELCNVLVQEYVTAYTGRYSVTQSAVDLSKITGVAQAADSLARALIPFASSSAAALSSARDTAQSYAYVYYKDLVDYATRVSALLGSDEVFAARNELSNAMSAAVIAEAHTGASVAQSHGLSIYIPEPSTYLVRYRDLAFARDTQWDEFLKAQQR